MMQRLFIFENFERLDKKHNTELKKRINRESIGKFTIIALSKDT